MMQTPLVKKWGLFKAQSKPFFLLPKNAEQNHKQSLRAELATPSARDKSFASLQIWVVRIGCATQWHSF